MLIGEATVSIFGVVKPAAAERLPRRGRVAGASQPATPKHEELLGRLRSLEAMVSELGSQVENAVTDKGSSGPESQEEISSTIESSTSSKGASSENVESASSQEFGEMVIQRNGELVVGDRFWTVFCGEVEHIFEAVRHPEPYDFEMHSPSESSGPVPPERSHSNYFNFLARQANAAAQYDLMHPSPHQMLFLWQTFVDDIDPLFKIVHVPSMTRLIRDLRGKYHSLGLGTEALIYAISFAAISILTEEDIALNFVAAKEQLTARYRQGTEQALEKAQILTTKDLSTLQALAIYVNVLENNDEYDAAWSLTGILVRVTIRLKLHRDGSKIPDLEPFETEMRRRIWWQICLIDSRVGSNGAPGLLISENVFNTRLPSNIDDADFNPKSASLPSYGDRKTDVTFFLIRCEIWRLSRQLTPILSKTQSSEIPLEQIARLFESAKTRIQKTYLDHLNIELPLDSFMITMAKLFFTRMHLCILEGMSSTSSNGPSSTNINSERILLHSITIVDCTYSLQNESSWSPWRWAIKAKAPPYIVLGTIFRLLLTQKWDSTCEKAWDVAAKYSDTIQKETPQYQQLMQLKALVEKRRSKRCSSSNFSTDGQSGHELSGITPEPQLALSQATVNLTITSTQNSSWGLNDDLSDLNLLTDVEMSMDWLSTPVEPWDFGDILDF
ncbi:hypothetical protein H072_6534 [Dactylellina haptotyla CBS 200.50]|uniref:Xylanolytic transcriptional activator regulatory domain-containing protein n=1 Tax=Dactylellina haptotyla (strain CBS 200.50) TaxID=1284197 RepID=S8BWJ5_DACHA|nr:hypothetical protein H072_6534 [Dactylellina haptotyla CBS 200.50]